jgi:sulfur carrier protein ThiS
MEYEGAELMVLEMVKEFLSESVLCTDEDYRPKGGIYIKGKRMPLDSDLVELNLIGKLIFTADNVVAFVNHNIYHQYEYRTNELAKVIKKIMDGAIINTFKFNFELEFYFGNVKRKHMNVRFKGVISKEDYQILIDSYF